MGNKILRPNQLQPFAGFNDDQISYLKDKFDILSDENQMLNLQKIASELMTSPEEASKILNYIDFSGQQSVDFYEFVCAAASLHQNDAEARQFIFQIYADGKQMTEESFNLLFGTVYRYLKFLNIIQDEYTPEIGSAKFKKYDYNNNNSMSFDQFESMVQNDYHLRLWMQALGFAKEQTREIEEKVQNHQIQNQVQLDEQQGDQFMATNAWMKVCDMMCPIPKNEWPEDKTPNLDLQISYVYGYRSYDTRDNLRYNAQGEVVYHTAACGIVLNKLKNTMRVNTTHNDDITCLDINVGKGIVATGQMGRWPSLVIWDSSSLQTKCIFAKKLERNISNVAISKSGKFVAASSMNEKHEIAVYDITKGSLIAFGQGPKSVIFAIKFNQNQDEIICACEKQVVFCRFTSGKLQNKKGVFGKAPLNPNLAIALLGGDSVITSMTSGLLVQWKGTFASKVYKQHTKSVGALCQRSEGGLISGDAIGNIIIWNQNMTKQRELSLEKLLGNVKSNMIRLISLFQQNGNILAGTRGGQIIQITKYSNANVLMDGHFDKQLWGLSVSSSKNQFFTGGEDKLLIKWDANKRRIISKKKLQYPIRCLDISRQNQLAVGQKNGIVLVFDASNMSILRKIADHKNPDRDVVGTVKFSPDGNTLAVGYSPPISKVYLYDVKLQKCKKIAQCKGASTRIGSIDFSMGGEALLATSIEPLFYKCPSGSQITAVSSLKSQNWATMNSKYTWFTQGIWPPCSDGSDINSVDRSNSKKFLATADDFSKVKIFRYPVCNKRQLYNEYKGHSSHVTGVKWLYDDKTLISIGGLQKSVIQWNVNEYQDYNYELQEKKQQAQQPQPEQQYEFGEQQNKQQGQVQMEMDEGDQALAVKPFLGQVKASTPLNYKPTHKNQPPNQDLKIHHVWGVRNLYINDKVRNQVRYNESGGSCLFITAALGVQMNLKTRNQTFYQGQSDDLITFAITKDRKYCATGQMAQLNKSKQTDKIVDVHIWDSQSKQQKVVLKRFHKRAVVLVEFSPSGKRILTVGQDDKNSLAVYDWEANRIAWSSPVDGAKVTGGAWKNQNQYMTVGLKHVKIWNQGKGVMQKLNGKWDPMNCVVFWNDKFVSGGTSGNIYLWGGGAGNPTKASQGTIQCFGIDPKGNLYSGCSKGFIKMWKVSAGKLSLDKIVCEVASFQKVDSGVLSLDFFKDQMLICTNSSSIYEFPVSQKNPNPQPIMTAHYKGQLWGQSWSPDKQKFVTGGDDATIRVFQIISMKQLYIFKMKDRIRGLDWQQSQGELIVVADYRGKIYLFDTELNLLDEGKTKFSKTKPRQQPFWIQDIKFSPNGKYVAFGAHGGASHLQIFEIDGRKFVPKSIVVNIGMTSALLSVDWSQESDMIAAVSQAYQLKFANLTGPVSASATKTTKWATWSGKFGFCVQEIHQDVDYTNINCVCVNPTRSLVATGGDDQKVRLFNYPVTIPKQQNKDFNGHSSHVTKVRFSNDEQHLLSIGGNDRTIILWKVTGNQQNQQKQEDEESQAQEQVEVPEDAQDIDDFPKIKKQVKTQAKTSENQFQMDQDEGDQFGASKPWLGAIKEPTKPYYKGLGKAPDINLRLEYAHGYRTKDCRNNLKYISETEVCYHTAALGVIMNFQENPRQQRFFDSHTDDIISITWNKDRSLIFTGQMGAKPIIHQWDTSCQKSIKAYKGVKKGVSAIAVNQKYLVGSGLDDDHYLYVFDIKTATLLASEKGGRDVIIGMKWVGESNFVSIGVKHYRYWQFSGKTIKGKTGSFGQNCNILCSIEADEDKIFTGASDGSVHIWSGNSISKSQKIHGGAVNALCLHEDILITGSSDKSIKLFKSKTLENITTINCDKLFQQSVNSSIRAIDALGKRLIVGTLGSQIYELECKQDLIKDTSSKSEFRLRGNYMNGHFAPNYVTNQVWGLSLFQDDKYVTCSDDGTLRVWDIEKKEQLTWVDLKFNQQLKGLVLKPKQKFLPDSVKGRCCAVSIQKSIVIGCKDGTIRILDSDLRPKYCKRISQKEISHIKFSPDGTTLAIGSHDTAIYIFSWRGGQIKQKYKMAKHSSYIKHFDFTKDGNYLHSTSGDYQLLFWDVNTGKQVTSGATLTRDYEWATWNVTLGWPVQGIWQPFTDGTDINSIDRTKRTYNGGMNLIATGNDTGEIRILEYPCIVKNSESIKGRGHSSHVTSVLFNLNDEILLSTGGEDQTVLQWVLQAE